MEQVSCFVVVNIVIAGTMQEEVLFVSTLSELQTWNVFPLRSSFSFFHLCVVAQLSHNMLSLPSHINLKVVLHFDLSCQVNRLNVVLLVFLCSFLAYLSPRAIMYVFIQCCPLLGQCSSFMPPKFFLAAYHMFSSFFEEYPCQFGVVI